MGKRAVLASALCVTVAWSCAKDDEGHGGGTGGRAGSGSGGTSGASASGGAAGSSGRGGSSGATTGGSSGKGGQGGSSGASGGSSGKGGRGGSAGTSGQGGSAGSAGGGDAGESAAGASGGEDGSGGEAGQGEPGGVSVLVTPDEGGKLSIDGATLVVGPGAVDANTRVTASSGPLTAGLPRESALRGLVYTFGPDNLVFDEPVLVTLPVTGSPPLGKRWGVAWLDEASNKWIPMPTVVTNGRAITGTRHFTSYTILEWNRVDTTDCDLVPAPCGGTPTGAYDMDAFCYGGPPPATGSVSFCPASSFQGTLKTSAGVMEFGPGDAAFRATTVLDFTRMILQTACLTTVGELVNTTFATCRDFEGPFGGLVGAPLACDGNVNQSCTCYTPKNVVEESIQSGTFTTDGTTLTISDTNGMSTSSYCVDAGNLYLTGSGDFDFVYVP